MKMSEGHKSEDLDAWQRQWKKTRKRGLFLFVLISGLLYWGAGSFLVMAGLRVLTHHWAIGLRETALVTFPAGLLYGVSQWYLNERRFGKLLKLKFREPKIG
jgi:hypothetical protein